MIRRFVTSARNNFKPLRPAVKTTSATTPFRFNSSMRFMHSLCLSQPSRPKLLSQSNPRAATDLQNKLFNGLLQFVKRNTAIPNFLAETKADDAKAEHLLTAIQSGNASADIFSDKKCPLYLLYLIKEKKLPFWNAMTVNVYLMALMQSSNKQSLREEDKDLKFYSYEVIVDKLVENQQLTAIGREYLHSICDRFQKINFAIDINELTEFVKSLPPVEQWLLQTRYERRHLSRSHQGNFNDAITAPLLANIPFLHSIAALDTVNHKIYWIPSSAVIHFLLQKISPNPLKMQPVFGNPGLQSLCRLHAEGWHPIAHYSPDVQSNPKTVHRYRCGPLLTWLHDIGHAFWGSMLSSEERHVLFTRFIPQLEGLKKEAQEHHDDEVVKKLNEVIENANDFDLTDVQEFIDPATRFVKYLARTFNVEYSNSMYSYGSIYDRPIFGNFPADRLFFLINKLCHSPSLSTEDKDLWVKILYHVTKRAKHDRHENALLALSTLAENSVEEIIQEYTGTRPHSKICWEQWLKIFESTRDSQALWERVSKERYNDLLILIVDYKLNFFHPYLPMTNEKHAQFVEFLKRKIQASHALAQNDVPDREPHLSVTSGLAVINNFSR